MALFSHMINKVPGLRFMADALDLQSGPGRQHLLRQHLLTSAEEITYQLEKVAQLKSLLEDAAADRPDGKQLLESLKHALSEVHDITGTLTMLQSGLIPDDIGLFEIKRLALIIDRLSGILHTLQCNVVDFKDVSEIITILDPDKQRVPHFYIYDAYNKELADLRRQYDALSKMSSTPEDEQKAEKVRLQCLEIEDSVRESLTLQLKPFSQQLLKDLDALADLDIWLAKASLALRFGLCKPVVGHQNLIDHNGNSIEHRGETQYHNLFNPAIEDALKAKGKKYQPVDIMLDDAPCLITGANMAGKTVLLKTVALAQYLFQYGFFVPAESAVIVPVDRIMNSMDDEQSELQGLSSFAAEMLKINGIIHASRTNTRLLALIDEPARTTNPQEGLALVNALLDMLSQQNVRSLITTHYSGFDTNCRRLRVSGLRTDEISSKPTIETINDYMDYSLLEVHPAKDGQLNEEDEVPHEALRIAAILEVDEALLERAKWYLMSSGKQH